MTKAGSKKEKKAKQRKKPEKLEFVQDFIPVKDINCGVIETTDGRYIKILEIEPINFMLRSSEEQFGIISSFASWLKISPMRLQFKSITRKADSDKHVATYIKYYIKVCIDFVVLLNFFFGIVVFMKNHCLFRIKLLSI